MDTPTLSRQVQDAAAQSEAIALVYLFGSRAEHLAGAGALGPMSDYHLGGIERRLDELDERLARLHPPLAAKRGDQR